MVASDLGWPGTKASRLRSRTYLHSGGAVLTFGHGADRGVSLPATNLTKDVFSVAPFSATLQEMVE